MHKMTVRSAERFALLKNSDFIAHAAIAQFSHLKARFNGVRKSDRREILATGFDNQADDGAIMHIKHALFHQVAVHSRIEVRVIGDIIYRSEEHTSELQSLLRISYAVLCLKKKIHKTKTT